METCQNITSQKGEEGNSYEKKAGWNSYEVENSDHNYKREDENSYNNNNEEEEEEEENKDSYEK